jgi:NADH dehydrogenase (ubiquinone) 1 alpha subcomplex subunit 5
MRPTTRLWATVNKATSRTLAPGQPTGLTGLLTHPAPRSTLIYLYSNTLSKLEKIPESSVYRQATEALTKKRLAIIKAVKPEGYDAWNERVQFELAKLDESSDGGNLTYDGQRFVLTQMYIKQKDDRKNEYQGRTPFAFSAGQVTEEMAKTEQRKYEEWEKHSQNLKQTIEPEPLFTLEQ